jgi:hypothetical protein
MTTELRMEFAKRTEMSNWSDDIDLVLENDYVKNPRFYKDYPWERAMLLFLIFSPTTPAEFLELIREYIK